MLAALTGRSVAPVGASLVSQAITPQNLEWLVNAVQQSRDEHAEIASGIAAREKLVAASGGHVGSSGRSKGGGRGGSSVGMRPANKADLAIKPLTNTNVPSRVPRVLSAIVWDLVKVRSTITTNTSSIVETNFGVSMATHPQASSWVSLYDQWCIPQFSVSFTSTEAPGGGGQLAELHSALDFDNVANIGSVTLIDDYGTAAVVILQPGRTFTRSIRPCVNLSGSIRRTWCDSATQSIAWNGIRTITTQASGAAISLVVETTIWYAFRNSI